MTTPTATLNADGSMTFYDYAPSSSGMQFTQEHWTASQVTTAQQAIAYDVTNHISITGGMGPHYVLAATLAVQNGLISDTQLQTWASGQNIQVTGIFNGAPANGTPQYSESLATAVNDLSLTTAANVPTLSQATAQAAVNAQTSSPASTQPGPTPIAGHDAVADQVQAAYIAYYGRPADVGGQAFWVDQLNKAGGSLNAIIDAFGNSTESQALYGGQNVTQQVTAIYGQQFNRAPDQAGLTYWTTQISNGKVSAATAALAIFNGATGTDKTIINNKLVVADAFTSGNATDSTGNSLYAGNPASANARSYLSAVGTDSVKAVQIAGIHTAVSHDIQGSITTDLAGVGAQVQLVGVSHVAAAAWMHA